MYYICLFVAAAAAATTTLLFYDERATFVWLYLRLMCRDWIYVPDNELEWKLYTMYSSCKKWRMHAHVHDYDFVANTSVDGIFSVFLRLCNMKSWNCLIENKTKQNNRTLHSYVFRIQ